jgi:hypothetical protein
MYWKHVNTRTSYFVSMVVVYKIWWALVGTLSDFATLLRHSTTKRLLTPGLQEGTESMQGRKSWTVKR